MSVKTLSAAILRRDAVQITGRHGRHSPRTSGRSCPSPRRPRVSRGAAPSPSLGLNAAYQRGWAHSRVLPPTGRVSSFPRRGRSHSRHSRDDRHRAIAGHSSAADRSSPTVSVDSFTPAEVCGSCHVAQYAEWRASSHANAVRDPVYRALVSVRQEDHLGRQDRFCLQCHSPIGTRGGDIVPGLDFTPRTPSSPCKIGCSRSMCAGPTEPRHQEEGRRCSTTAR